MPTSRRSDAATRTRPRLSFDAVAASLKRQVPELLDRHKVRDVEYRVFVKDGKAILRAVPKI